MNGLIFSVSSLAGSILTDANLSEAGVLQRSYSMAELLMKPGLEVLLELQNLSDYLPFVTEFTINCAMLGRAKDGVYSIRSTYDGKILQISIEQLFGLLAKFQPSKVLLPADTVDKDVKDLKASKVYFSAETNFNTDYSYQTFKFRGQPIYILSSEASIDEEQSLTQLAKLIQSYEVETDIPALDALNGVVYSACDSQSILSKSFAFDFQAIDSDCSCYTCTQGLTRAYLHHLYQQTPLLAQRYLALHNIFYLLHLPVNEIPL